MTSQPHPEKDGTTPAEPQEKQNPYLAHLVEDASPGPPSGKGRGGGHRVQLNSFYNLNHRYPPKVISGRDNNRGPPKVISHLEITAQQQSGGRSGHSYPTNRPQAYPRGPRSANNGSHQVRQQLKGPTPRPEASLGNYSNYYAKRTATSRVDP
ncbi:hypothetical protein HK104_006607, partial [Borealophlyctis nickersoniae]